MEFWPGGPRFRQAEHVRLGTDSVLLADFTPLGGARRGIDLGCASGALMLMLLARAEGLHMTGLEIVEAAARRAADNLRLNGWEARGDVVCGDIRAARQLFRAGSFDLAVANPPYFPAGSGALPADPDRAAARGELCCTLSELCAAAGWLLRTGGRFCLVHRPERLGEAIVCMSAQGLEPKRLRLVCAREDRAPSLVLLEGRRGGAPGLVIEPSLTLRDAEGRESEALRRICHR